MALIERQAARVAELEAERKKPKKTSSNSHTPPSQGGPGRKNRKDDKAEGKKKPRPSRPGTTRPLSDDPDRTERCVTGACLCLKISEGAIANIYQATTTAMEKARAAIGERLVKAQVIVSDETTTRINTLSAISYQRL